MPDRGMTQAWNGVEAALPLGWRLTTLALGPRAADPEIRSAEWVADRIPSSPDNRHRVSTGMGRIRSKR